MVTPAMGHEVAKEIGAPFYESSVLTKFGVSDIFINTARAALIERRKLKFWNTQLRKVQRPLIQPPVTIPMPALPPIRLERAAPAPLAAPSALAALLDEQSECDVAFVARGVRLEAHRVILALSCKVFEDLFSCEGLSKVLQQHQQSLHLQQRRHHQQHSRSGGGGGLLMMEVEEPDSPLCFRNQSVTSDDECLLDNDLHGGGAVVGSPEKSNGAILAAADPDDLDLGPSPPSSSTSVTAPLLPLYPVSVGYSHPAVEAVEVRRRADPYRPQGEPGLLTVVTMHADVTSAALQLVLQFLYSGRVCKVGPRSSVLEASFSSLSVRSDRCICEVTQCSF